MSNNSIADFLKKATALGLTDKEIDSHINTHQKLIKGRDQQAAHNSNPNDFNPLDVESEDYFADEFEQLRQESIWYLISPLIQASLPHRKPRGNEFTRINGRLQLSILSPSNVGLPSGVPPRLLLMYICSIVKKSSDRTIYMGKNMRELLRRIQVSVTSGKNGSVLKYTNELTKLMATSFTIIENFEGLNHKRQGLNIQQAHIADTSTLWHDDEAVLKEAHIVLSQQFFDAIKETAVPLDAAAILQLKSSPMALDIYSWLTFRLKYLKKVNIVPWGALMQQLGSHYKEKKTFKHNFLNSLKIVLEVYNDARVAEHTRGLIIKPSKPHVPEKIT